MQLRMNIPPRATRTVFCVGSGPSLTREDCAAIEKTGCSIIAVNNSWQMFDDIYALYAGDLSWWKQYGSTIPEGDSASDSQPGGGEIIFVGVQAILWTGGRGK